MKHRKYSIPNAAVFLVGFCIPFFSVTVSIGGVWSVSILSIALYGITMLPYLNEVFRIKKEYGGIVLIPLYYFFFLTLVNALYYNGGDTPIVNMTMFQCFLLFAFLLAHAYRDSKAMPICLYGIGMGCILLSILAVIGVGVEINPATMRLELFGMNPNSTGIMMGMGFIIIVNEFVLHDKLKLGAARFLFLLSAFPIMATIVMTGSRTAVVLSVAAAGIILFMTPVKRRFLRYAIIIVGVLAFVYITQRFMTEDNILVERLTKTEESGDLSGRDDLWKNIIPAICENPIWGYGETGYYGFVAAKALGEDISPHNVFLEVLALTGMIGLVMWLVLWFRVILNAWLCYRKEKILLPMLMLLPMMVCLFSGQFITVSWAYIIYAYILSEYRVVKLNVNDNS